MENTQRCRADTFHCSLPPLICSSLTPSIFISPTRPPLSLRGIFSIMFSPASQCPVTSVPFPVHRHIRHVRSWILTEHGLVHHSALHPDSGNFNPDEVNLGVRVSFFKGVCALTMENLQSLAYRKELKNTQKHGNRLQHKLGWFKK